MLSITKLFITHILQEIWFTADKTNSAIKELRLKANMFVKHYN